MANILMFSKDKKIDQVVETTIKEHGLPIHKYFWAEEAENFRVMMVAMQPQIIIIEIDAIEKESANEYIATLKQQHSQCEILAIMGERNYKIVRDIMRSGARDCLFKPVNSGEFWLSLNNLLSENKNRSLVAKSFSVDFLSQQIQPALKTSLVLDLILGNIKNVKEIWDRSKIIGLITVPNLVLLITIDDFSRLTANKSEFWKQSIRQEVYDSLQDSIKLSIPEALSAIVGGDSIAVLMGLPPQHEEWSINLNAINLAEQIKMIVEQKTGLTVSIGIGNRYEDARNLHLSYQEALKALEHKFFIGNNIVVHFSDVDPFLNNISVLAYGEELELANKVRLGDRDSSLQSLDEIMSKIFFQDNVDPETIKLQMLELMIILGRAAIDGGADSKELLSLYLEFASELDNIEILEHVGTWLKKIVESFVELVIVDNNEYNLLTVRKSVKYMKDNFNKEISLKEVAQHVHLSASYFCHIFKKEIGCTFVEYLTDLRIENAKELLQNLDVSISQVAHRVGYDNPRYFSRVFKNKAGMSPSDYRNCL